MRFLSADLMLMPDGFKSGLGMNVDESGRIIEIVSVDAGKTQADILAGILIPGWINAHCHLELSHMKGMISRGTGLGAFGLEVVRRRNEHSESDIIHSAKHQEALLVKSGTKGVGDISNLSLTAEIKSKSELNWMTFVECIGLHPSRAATILEEAASKKNTFLHSSNSFSELAAHAPYSVSRELMNGISAATESVTSIHFMESKDELSFMLDKSGPFSKLYEFLGLDLGFFPANTDSIEWIQPLMNARHKTLLIHATMMQEWDATRLKRMHGNPVVCLCPRANLYIENRLPDIPMMIEHEFEIVIGTDSLASNDDLDLFNEVRTIQQHFPEIPLSDILCWATKNGANVLGWGNELGTFETGKRPGFILIENAYNADGKLSNETTTRVIHP